MKSPLKSSKLYRTNNKGVAFLQYFFETSDTITQGVGWKHFDVLHISELIFTLLAVIGFSFLYKKLGVNGRKTMRILLAAFIIFDELVKIAITGFWGDYFPDYLPLHLCSINIILITIHIFKPSRMLDNFLYSFCIPAAALALLTPTWTKLPFLNIMHLHSVSVHIALLLYPVMLTAAGDIRPDYRQIWKALVLLAFLALPISIFNHFFDTNFMFLNRLQKGTPLVWFDETFGSYLFGFPILLAAILFIMYIQYHSPS